MIRPSVLKNFLDYRPNGVQIDFKALTLLYITMRQAQLLSEAGESPMINAGRREALVQMFISDATLANLDDPIVQLGYYDDTNSIQPGEVVTFDFGLLVELKNTWVDPAVTEAADGDGKKDERREERRSHRTDAFHHRARNGLFGGDVMSATDLVALRCAFMQAENEFLQLLKDMDYHTEPLKKRNRNLSEGQVVYRLGTPDRFDAAHLVMDVDLNVPSKREQEAPCDIRVRALNNPVPEFAFSGDFGTAKEWTEQFARQYGSPLRHRNGSRADMPREEPNEFETRFFNAYITLHKAEQAKM